MEKKKSQAANSRQRSRSLGKIVYIISNKFNISSYFRKTELELIKMNESKPSIQDFSVINTHVEKHVKDYDLKDNSNGFYFLALSLLFDLQDDEIKDSITDSHFISVTNKGKGKDRGIDAIYIDESSDKGRADIHIFNFKYAGTFDKTKSNFPSSEIDKIVGFINDLLSQDEALEETVNPILFSKVEEIWQLFQRQNPNFHIHLCSNHYIGLEQQEKKRFENAINLHSNFTIYEHKMQDFVNKLTKKGKLVINAKLRAVNKNFFEKSDGDIRALIVNVDVRDLLRIVLDNEEIRSKADLEDYNDLKNYPIQEDAFEDNVRVYLKQRSKINRNIKQTALSDERHRLFYFNNGITITCDNFYYQKSQRSPIIEIENIQVVNGSQTIHALYDAFESEPDNFDDLDILCRIYQTNNTELSTKIAEYTNSQNPVNSRDIRSIDYVQQKLEQELKALGYFYERKKNQYYDQPKNNRLDSEKAGQVLMAFYNKMPSEAKNQKKIIFAEKYDDVFNDDINAEKLLIPYKLFERIEKIKAEKKETLIEGIDEFEKSSYISYSSYWVLYFIGELSRLKEIDFKLKNLESIWNLSTKAYELIEDLIRQEREFLKGRNETYSHSQFFKYGKPKKYFEDLKVDEVKKKYLI
ncbi:AIPR family protein [Pontibacter cellulosilyticus]|uniref:AIPR family protein n=1 Tax=Pontibacter cellulosilyticus TaxID=1720253 RepID=A0A923SHN3_9BACT|nr:AIPR family protein [Pontibacter cellulosilyticus]MBC5991929.1 AIPR family protein [Pontibacter cellulosilyticus]